MVRPAQSGSSSSAFSSFPTNQTCLQFFFPPLHICSLFLWPQKPLGRRWWEYWPGEQSGSEDLGRHAGDVIGVWKDGIKKKMGKRRGNDGMLKKWMKIIVCGTGILLEGSDTKVCRTGSSKSWAVLSEAVLFGYTEKRKKAESCPDLITGPFLVLGKLLQPLHISSLCRMKTVQLTDRNDSRDFSRVMTNHGTIRLAETPRLSSLAVINFLIKRLPGIFLKKPVPLHSASNGLNLKVTKNCISFSKLKKGPRWAKVFKKAIKARSAYTLK